MRENIRLGSLILVVAGLILAWVAHGRSAARAKLESSGIETPGTVVHASVNEKIGKPSDNTYWIWVTYDAQGTNEPVTSTFKVTATYFDKITDGSKILSSSVPIVYSPDNPKEAIIRGGSLSGGGTFAMKLMLVLAGLGLGIFLLTMLGRGTSPATSRMVACTSGPEWLPQVMGSPPRKWPFFEGLWLLAKSKCMSRYKIDAWALTMRLDAQAVWAIRIKANSQAYDPASKERDFYGVVLLAPHLPASTTREHLSPVAEWIWKHRGSLDPDWSDEIKDFMKWVDDDLMKGWEERKVPYEISRGLNCILTTGLFRKTDMPGKAMAMRFMPMLYDAEQKVATLVPPKYWPSAYKTEWLNELKNNARNRESDVDDEKALAAFEVTELPPSSLHALESHLEDICASRNIACLFLNTGSIQDRDGNDLPLSGELQFLGKFWQWENIVNSINEGIYLHVDPEHYSKAKIRTMNLDEFFQRFSWLLDELENRRS